MGKAYNDKSNCLNGTPYYYSLLVAPELVSSKKTSL